MYKLIIDSDKSSHIQIDNDNEVNAIQLTLNKVWSVSTPIKLLKRNFPSVKLSQPLLKAFNSKR